MILLGFMIFSKSISLLVAGVWLSVCVEAVWIEYELAGVDNCKEGVFVTNLKSKRIDKFTFALNGTFDFNYDFSNDFDAEVKLYHSSKGNNQFVLTPYKIPKNSLCNIVDGVWRKSVAESLKNTSNLPQAEDNESLCAKYKKGTYEVNQYPLQKSNVPKILQPGYYKAELIASKKNSDESSKLVIHVKLY